MRHLHFISALLVVGLILLCLESQATPADEVPPDLAGKYRCEGQDLNGEKYTGEVTITKNGETYELEWNVTYEQAGQMKYAGVGLLTDNILSASWEGHPRAAVMAYKVGKNGGLSGRWTILGNRKTTTEQLTRVKR